MAWIDYDGSMGFVENKPKLLDDLMGEVNSAFESIKSSYVTPTSYYQEPAYYEDPEPLYRPAAANNYDYVGDSSYGGQYLDQATGNYFSNGFWWNANDELWDDYTQSWLSPAQYQDFASQYNEYNNAQNQFNMGIEGPKYQQPGASWFNYDSYQDNPTDYNLNNPEISNFTTYEGPKWWEQPENKNAVADIYAGYANVAGEMGALAESTNPAYTARQRDIGASNDAPGGGGLMSVLGPGLEGLGIVGSYLQENVGGPAAQIGYDVLFGKGGKSALRSGATGGRFTNDPEAASYSYTNAIQANKDLLKNEDIPWYLKETYYTLTDPLTLGSVAVSKASRAGALEGRVGGVTKALLDNGDLATVSAFNLTSGYVNDSEWFKELAKDNPSMAILASILVPLGGAVAGNVAGGLAVGAAKNADVIAKSVSDVAMYNIIALKHPEIFQTESSSRALRQADEALADLNATKQAIADQWLALRLAAAFTVQHPGPVLDAIGNAVKTGAMSPVKGLQILGDAMANFTKDPTIQAIKQGLVAGLAIPVTGVPIPRGRISRDLTVNEDGIKVFGKGLDESLAAHQPTRRTWFHRTKNRNFESPDPQKGLGGNVGIAQGPGSYFSTKVPRGSRYGGREFAGQFDGNALDLTVAGKPTDFIDEARTVSWKSIADTIAAKFEGLKRAQEGPLSEPVISELVRNIRKALTPNHVRMLTSSAHEDVAKSYIAANPGTQDFMGYHYRAAILNEIEDWVAAALDEVPEIITTAKSYLTEEQADALAKGEWHFYESNFGAQDGQKGYGVSITPGSTPGNYKTGKDTLPLDEAVIFITVDAPDKFTLWQDGDDIAEASSLDEMRKIFTPEFTQNLLAKYNYPSDSAGIIGTLFGKFEGVTDVNLTFRGSPQQEAEQFALSIVNNTLAELGVDSLYHISSNVDGEVLIVLNENKMKIGMEADVKEGSRVFNSLTDVKPRPNNPTATFHDYLRALLMKTLGSADAMRGGLKPDELQKLPWRLVDGVHDGKKKILITTSSGTEMELPVVLNLIDSGILSDSASDLWVIRNANDGGFVRNKNAAGSISKKMYAPEAKSGFATAEEAAQWAIDNAANWLSPPEKSITMKLFSDKVDPEDAIIMMNGMIGWTANMGMKQAILSVPGFAAGYASAPDDADHSTKLTYAFAGAAIASGGVHIFDKVLDNVHKIATRMPKEKIGAVRETPRPFDQYGQPMIGPQPVMVSSILGEMHPERELRGVHAFKAQLDAAYDKLQELRAGAGEYVPKYWRDSDINRLFQEVSRAKKTINSLVSRDREIALVVVRSLGADKDGVIRRITEDAGNASKIVHATQYTETAIASGMLTRAQVKAIQDLEPVLGFQTVQDIAAKFDTWKKSGLLSKEDIELIEQLRTIIGPYQALKESLPNVKAGNVRQDIEEGGFYLPRGTADRITGDELEPRLRTRGFGKITAGKDGSQKHAKFESMGEAIRQGYEYKPFHEVLDTHTRWTLEKAVLNMVNQHVLSAVDETGARVAENAYRVDAEIKELWGAGRRELNKLVGQVNRAERSLKLDVARKTEAEKANVHVSSAMDKAKAASARLTEEKPKTLMTAAGPVRIKMPASPKNITTAEGVDRGIRYFDTAINRIERRIALLEGRTGERSEQLRALSAELEAFKANANEFRAKWEAAKKDARNLPRDRMLLNEFAGLEGYDFPIPYANAIKRAVNEFMGDVGNVGKFDKAIEMFNGTLRAVRATGDISFAGIQGLLAIATDPTAYVEAWGLGMKALLDEGTLGQFMKDFDANAPVGFTTQDFARDGLHIAGPNETEYSAGRGISVRGHKLSNAYVIKQSNQAFSTFSTAARISMYRNALEVQRGIGRDINNKAFREQLATSVNRITGHADRRFGGMLGSATMFAPRFFESQIELVLKAAADGSIEGEMARAALLKTVGMGAVLTFALNEAMGEETIFDPTDSNFMRIRDVAGTGVDLSVFGPWDSLIRGVVKALPVAMQTDGSVEIKDWSRWVDDSLDFARSKSSPLLALGWDIFTDKNYFGEDVDTQDPMYWVRSVLPLSISGIGAEPWLKTAIGTTGMKATPLTETETALKQEWEDGDLFKDNQFVTKKPAKLSELDPLTSRRVKEKYGVIDEEIKARYSPELQKILNDVAAATGDADARFKTDKTYTVAQWKEVWSTQMRDQARGYQMEFAKDAKVTDDPMNPRRWVEDWYATFEKANIGGISDNNAVSGSSTLADLQAPLIAKLKEIPWYDNVSKEQKTAYDYIKQYALEGKSDVRRMYLEAMETLSAARYFDISRHVGLDRQQEVKYQTDRIVAMNDLLAPELMSKYPEQRYTSAGDRYAHYWYDKLLAEGMPPKEANLQATYLKYVGQAANNPEYLKIKNDPELQDELLWLSDKATWAGINNASQK